MLLAACTPKRTTVENTLYVSILPLRSIVEGIVGDDFRVEVLVPAGASPETFEPTPRQFVGLNKAQLIFNVGLIDFEPSLLGKIENQGKIVDLSRGIGLIEGSCSHASHKHDPEQGQECGQCRELEQGQEPPHGQDHEPEQDHWQGQGEKLEQSHKQEQGLKPPHEQEQGHEQDHGLEQAHKHAHGVDPHVWTSPKALQRMAANAYEAIRAAYPDSTKYGANYERLQERLQQLDTRTAEKIARSGVKYFIIYHPALTYYARDYGLRQVAIEADGKEPSAKQLTSVIRQARQDGVRKIFYQSQFPASTVEVIARDIDADYVEIDPLHEDAIANIDIITDLITAQ